MYLQRACSFFWHGVRLYTSCLKLEIGANKRTEKVFFFARIATVFLYHIIGDHRQARSTDAICIWVSFFYCHVFFFFASWTFECTHRSINSTLLGKSKEKTHKHEKKMSILFTVWLWSFSCIDLLLSGRVYLFLMRLICVFFFFVSHAAVHVRMAHGISSYYLKKPVFVTFAAGHFKGWE